MLRELFHANRGLIAGVCVGALQAIAAETLIAGEYARIEPDVSPLPIERRFVADVLSSRVAERVPNSHGAALKVAFRIDPSLGGENASVTVKGAHAEIVAARPRALFYGIAKLLENLRFGEKGFAIEDGAVDFRPVKPVRIAYWARHFHNWYHMASAAELTRYAEDMMLMGMNGFDYQYLYPGVNRAGATAKEMAVFLANSKALYDHIRAMDADLLTGGGGNQIPDDSPEEWRGAPETDPVRCNLGFNACPAKPAALAYMLKSRQDGLATFQREGVSPKWFLHWPFDEGGCECDTCRPWGGNGFIGLCRKYDRLNKAAYPGAKTVLSTWIYHDDDYDGLWAYLAKPESKWIDGLMVDAHGDFPKYVLTHPLPRKLPIITFPEISMYHRWPWGGYGAIAMPARFERLFRQCERVVDGFMFYSEGLSEDVNKFLVTRLYTDPSAHWQAIMKDYARLFLPGIAPEDFVRFCAMLEESHEFPVQDTQLAAEPPSAEFFAKYGPRTKEIAAFAEKLERALLPRLRTGWRWRQLKLRTEIDAYAFNSRKLLTDGYAKMARELIELYHVDPQEGYYEDYTNHKAVRPYLPDIRLEGHPGETVEYRVRRTNRTERDIVVKPEAKCVPKTFVGEAGVVREDGTVDWNGKKTLRPGESVMLAGRIRIPKDAKEGHYGAHVLFPHGRSKGSEYWWISLECVNSPKLVKAIAYRDINGCELDLKLPFGVTNFPTVVWFHGGGLTSGRRDWIALDASRVAIASVDYRLMPKVGPADCIDDAAAAAAWVKRHIAEYGGDANRVFISGHSAGGYLTFMLGLDERWLAKYGRSPFDFAGYMPLSGQVTKHFAVRKHFKHRENEFQPIVDEWAPMHYLQPKTPPFCVAVGDAKIEWRMRVEENLFMCESLKAMGNRNFEFHSFPGKDHCSCLGPAIGVFQHFVDCH